MKGLYNALFVVFLLLTSPYYLLRMWRRGNWQTGFGERFGNYDNKLKQAITNRQLFWLHAVSVGEVNLCIYLIQALEERLPNVKMLVSTTTTTGMDALQQRLPSRVTKIYNPIDRYKYVTHAFAALRPLAVILVESEIWPNIIWRAQRTRIPVFLVNARLSERSYRRYKRFAFLFQPIFRSFAGVGAQNEEDAARLRELGCRPHTVHVVGSLKYDAATLAERRSLDVPALLNQIGVEPGTPILLGGSTHAGEEGILADIFLRLKEKFPNLFLIIVPRHFERSREVGRGLETRGLKFAYRTEITNVTHHEHGTVQCLLVNTTGELKFFYETATVVFIGKSLTAEGGQNPIEPGALGKAMVFGPNMQNFPDVTRQFMERKAAIQVKDAAGLEKAVAELLSDDTRRQELGQRAQVLVNENLGAIDRTVDMIVSGLDPKEFYIKPK